MSMDSRLVIYQLQADWETKDAKLLHYQDFSQANKEIQKNQLQSFSSRRKQNGWHLSDPSYNVSCEQKDRSLAYSDDHI